MKKRTFEQALSELELLAKKMEDENIELEQSIKCYEKSVELISFCEKILSDANQKIISIN